MNIIFLTLFDYYSTDQRGIYPDLIKTFIDNNHQVYVVSPAQNKVRKTIIKDNKLTIYKPYIHPYTKTHLFNKAISLLTFEKRIQNFLSMYHHNQIDLVIYSTPPIQYTNLIKYIKKKYDAKSYLLLKDIFPQNAVDMKLFNKKSFIYKYFRKKEESLYKLSDFIGCMSAGNVEYILKHNNIDPNKLHINPNSKIIDKENKIDSNLLTKYKIPLGKIYIVYGGNVGIPQGIDFLIKCIYSTLSFTKLHYVIIGSGTKWNYLIKATNDLNLENLTLINELNYEEYQSLVNNFDYGLIMLNSNFTIPNYPSRILSYMNAKLPIIAITDLVTDIRSLVIDNQIGYWTEFGNLESFLDIISKISPKKQNTSLSTNSFNYLINHFDVKISYDKIIKVMNE
jgi:glycosyltransferase involved in cell wall biosynthesis